MSDGALVLRLTGLMVRQLVLVVPVSSEGIKAGEKLAYYSCQPGRKMLVYF